MPGRSRSFMARCLKMIIKMFLKIAPADVAGQVVRYIPGFFGDYARVMAYRKVMKRLGRNSYLSDGVVVLYPENIEIGDDVSVNQLCVIHGMGGVRIGSKSRIGYGVKLLSFNHEFAERGMPIMNQGYDKGMIDIGEDVWIGANSIVLKGVKIGRGSVIGACSLVNKDVPPYSVAIGIPARVMKKRG